MKCFQLESVAYRKRHSLFFVQEVPYIRISTIQLPGDMGYETCLFYMDNFTDNEVVETYDTLQDAVEGHARWAREYGVKTAQARLT